MHTGQDILKRARALLLLLIFAGSWAAAPASLAMPEAVTCGMACCEETGVCYCAHDHQEAGSDAAPRFSPTGIQSPCSERCATVPSASLTLFVVRHFAHPAKLPAGGVPLLPDTDAQPIQSLLLDCDRSPRAPPTPLIDRTT